MNKKIGFSLKIFLYIFVGICIIIFLFGVWYLLTTNISQRKSAFCNQKKDKISCDEYDYCMWAYGSSCNFCLDVIPMCIYKYKVYY